VQHNLRWLNYDSAGPGLDFTPGSDNCPWKTYVACVLYPSRKFYIFTDSEGSCAVPAQSNNLAPDGQSESTTRFILFSVIFRYIIVGDDH